MERNWPLPSSEAHLFQEQWWGWGTVVGGGHRHVTKQVPEVQSERGWKQAVISAIAVGVGLGDEEMPRNGGRQGGA